MSQEWVPFRASERDARLPLRLHLLPDVQSVRMKGWLDNTAEVRAARAYASNGGRLPHLLRQRGGAVDPPLLLPRIFGGRALYVLAGVTGCFFLLRKILQAPERRERL